MRSHAHPAGSCPRMSWQEWCSRGLPGEQLFAKPAEVMAQARQHLAATLMPSMHYPTKSDDFEDSYGIHTSNDIDWDWLMNVDDVDDIWSCNQHTYTYLADLNDLNCHVPLPASEHLWSEEQYSVAELVSMAMRIVEASRSITWDIWDQEQRTSAGTLNLTNLSVDSTSREAGAEACWNRPCGSIGVPLLDPHISTARFCCFEFTFAFCVSWERMMDSRRQKHSPVASQVAVAGVDTEHHRTLKLMKLSQKSQIAHDCAIVFIHCLGYPWIVLGQKQAAKEMQKWVEWDSCWVVEWHIEESGMTWYDMAWHHIMTQCKRRLYHHDCWHEVMQLSLSCTLHKCNQRCMDYGVIFVELQAMHYVDLFCIATWCYFDPYCKIGTRAFAKVPASSKYEDLGTGSKLKQVPSVPWGCMLPMGQSLGA